MREAYLGNLTEEIDLSTLKPVVFLIYYRSRGRKIRETLEIHFSFWKIIGHCFFSMINQ